MKTRFRRFIITFVTVIMAFTGSLAFAPVAQAIHLTHDVFFFVPHQDDEVLQYGAAIAEHVAAGRTVWVVLLTDGGSSVQCGIQYPGNRPACVAARDQEFTNGVTAMGGHPVIRTDRAIDGKLTQVYAKAVIMNYYPNYPNSSFKAPSEFDGSTDHSYVGKALRSTGITDARYYIKHSEWGGHSGTLTAQYNQDTVLAMYPFGKSSVLPDFTAAAFANGGNKSKAYA